MVPVAAHCGSVTPLQGKEGSLVRVDRAAAKRQEQTATSRRHTLPGVQPVSWGSRVGTQLSIKIYYSTEILAPRNAKREL